MFSRRRLRSSSESDDAESTVSTTTRPLLEHVNVVDIDAVLPQPARTRTKFRARPRQHADVDVIHRQWAVIGHDGVCHRVRGDKRAIARAKELGVTTRELRMFDPVYQHLHGNTTRILVRENALLFVMDGYRLIITQNEVLIPIYRLNNEQRDGLLADLERKLQRRHRILSAPSGADVLRAGITGGAPGKAALGLSKEDEESDGDEDEEILPFELCAFEVALRRVTNNVKKAVDELNDNCHPALEALTHRVARDTLDRVRIIKNRHSTMTKKVEAVVEELERIMDDDDDMKRMVLSDADLLFEVDMAASSPNLFAAASAGPFSQSWSQSWSSPRKPAYSVPLSQDAGAGAGAAQPGGGAATVDAVPLPHSPRRSVDNHLRRLESNTTVTSDEADEHHVLLVENLLECYFAVLDHAFDKLKTLEEIIDK